MPRPHANIHAVRSEVKSTVCCLTTSTACTGSGPWSMKKEVVETLIWRGQDPDLRSPRISCSIDASRYASRYGTMNMNSTNLACLLTACWGIILVGKAVLFEVVISTYYVTYVLSKGY